MAWVAYRDDGDYLCPAGLIAFDDDIWDGGVGSSVTETHLLSFLFSIQRQGSGPSSFEYPPVDDMAKDMLEHEAHLLQRPVAASAWSSIKEDRAILYAILVYALHRKAWKKTWVDRACGLLHELHGAGVPIGRLRSLRDVDPLQVERARDYKALGDHVPKRLQRTFAALQEIAAETSAVSADVRLRIEPELREYGAFVEEYKRRRKQRFDEIADDDLRTAAGTHRKLLRDRRGQPSRSQLVRRVDKAVFVALTDELVKSGGLTTYKAAGLADQLVYFIFVDARERAGDDPFKAGHTKRALNAYRYARKSLSVSENDPSS
ncbi:MAG TPA: hypothetical protein VFX92_06320 [Candidatus Krumholzibacteria bacterium]|nr:hypothetical protein [Candidatus Krumholzibacteria bacterium]